VTNDKTKLSAAALSELLAHPTRKSDFGWIETIRWDFSRTDEKGSGASGEGLFLAFEGTRDGQIRISFRTAGTETRPNIDFSLVCLPDDYKLLAAMISHMGDHIDDLIRMAKQRG
jgi:hypothetical protein